MQISLHHKSTLKPPRIKWEKIICSKAQKVCLTVKEKHDDMCLQVIHNHFRIFAMGGDQACTMNPELKVVGSQFSQVIWSQISEDGSSILMLLDMNQLELQINVFE
jgi:hypothetical protein